MPQPTSSDVHVNRPLTNISVAYMQAQNNFVADQVFPPVPVDAQTDSYFIYDKDDFLRDEAAPRAPSSESAGGGYKLSTDTYRCVVEAYHKDIDDQVRANFTDPLSPDRDATMFVTQKLLIRREVQWMSEFFTTGVWGTDITPGTLWSAASSTPIKNVIDGKMAIQAVTGMEPNTLVVGPKVHAALMTNADILDRIKYTSKESVSEALLAGLFGVSKYIIAKGVKSSGPEGGTQTTDFIAGKHALLCYVAPTPSLLLPSAGYSFWWRGLLGAVGGSRIASFRMPELKSDRIEGEQAYDYKKVASGLGYFFNGAVA